MNLEPLRELEAIARELDAQPIFQSELHRARWYVGLSDRIRRALAQLDDGWIDISLCPKVSQQRILLAWPDGTVEQGMWLNNTTWEGYRPESLRPWPKGEPTHFRPLPSPPAQEDAT